MGKNGRLVVLVCCVLCGVAVVPTVASAGLASLVPKAVTSIKRAVNGTWVAGYKFRDAANAGTYATTKVTYSASRMGALLKPRFLNPGTIAASVAVGQILDGVGWFINSAQNQIMKPGGPPQLQPNGQYLAGYQTVSGLDRNLYGTVAESAAAEWTALQGAGTTATGYYTQAAAYGKFDMMLTYDNTADQLWQKITPVYTNDPAQAVVEDVPVTDDELEAATRDAAPSLAWDALVDPLTGLVTQTAELTAAMGSLQDAINANRDADPANDIAVEAVPEVNSEAGPTTDQAKADAQSLELPGFCSWAGVVCDWIGWTKETPVDATPPTVPTQQVGAYSEYVTGLGEGSCPAAPTFNFDGKTFEIPIQPACDAMTMFRPIVLGVAYLVAGLIVVKV